MLPNHVMKLDVVYVFGSSCGCVLTVGSTGSSEAASSNNFSAELSEIPCQKRVKPSLTYSHT